jgi:PAS domain S-box-containing protein
VKAENGEAGIACLKGEEFDIVLLDLMMPGMDGFSVLGWIRDNRPGVQVIVITGFATVAKAVAAMKEGAFDFVGKPFTPDYIRIVVQRAYEKRALLTEAARLREEKAVDLAAIVEEQSRLRSAFACMEEAILVTNRAGVVVLHNPVAVRVLEIQTDPVIGKPLSDSLSNADAVEMIGEAVRNGSTVAKEFPPGTISRLFLRAHCAPVRTAAGKILGSVTVFEDITAHKQVDQQKSEFVAMVAHELRAPLAAIQQMIFSLKGSGEENAERRRELLGRINARVDDQLQLIENLLNLSKLDTGIVSLNVEPVRGDDIIGAAVERVSARAEGKRIELQYVGNPAEWWLNADRDHIIMVFSNIIDNAIKYTPAGGEVHVASTLAGSLARVTISDTGIGIAAADLPHIFDRFFRVRGKNTRGITGSGLGLSVAKKVVEALGGSIDVTSEPGRGTTFIVTLLLADPPAAATAR